MDGPIGDLKTYRLGEDEIVFAVSGKAKPDGSLYNPEKAEKPHTSGKLYKSMFVRHVSTLGSVGQLVLTVTVGPLRYREQKRHLAWQADEGGWQVRTVKPEECTQGHPVGEPD